jgi:UDP-glucose:(glucosyl)LPS alpha-1,2-glucosyltransferase
MKRAVMISAPIHSVPPKKGAAVEWWMYQVSQRLRNFEPHIIAISNDDEALDESLQGVAFHRIKIGRVYKRIFQKITRWDPWSYGHRANQIIDRLGADIVHVHNTPSLFIKLLRLNRDSRRRYALHMHNEKSTAGLPDSCNLFVVSRYLESYYRDRLPKAKIQIITNGVDTAVFKPKWSVDALSPFPALDTAIPAGKKVLLYVGRMSPEKGPLKLVEAFSELIKRRQDVFLVMVGEFSKGDNERARYGNAIRNRCNAIDRHCLLMDVVAPGLIHHVYYRADLVVIPSEFQEPFGMVCIEAMAAGIPVLVTRRGGLPELVREPERGVFIRDVDNPDRFAEQLSELIDSGSLLEAVSFNARKYVERCHDWTHVALQTESAYQNLFAIGN